MLFMPMRILTAVKPSRLATAKRPHASVILATCYFSSTANCNIRSTAAKNDLEPKHECCRRMKFLTGNSIHPNHHRNKSSCQANELLRQIKIAEACAFIRLHVGKRVNKGRKMQIKTEEWTEARKAHIWQVEQDKLLKRLNMTESEYVAFQGEREKRNRLVHPPMTFDDVIKCIREWQSTRA